MACIIKIPTENSKGVVTFTTPERDKFILTDINIQEKIKLAKDRWVIGLHHNWHDYNFSYNSLFDFSMAGECDLREIDGKAIPLISLDACNFSPKVFKFSKNEKFWDILYVARAVYFKKIPEFFKMIRKLYDQGLFYRVLLISPIPDECKNNPNCTTSFCNIRDVYNEMFNQKEQDLFTLLTTDYRSPFPFDIPTIAHFYQSSKIFVHAADDERRCRVVGYALATGMPVVCMKAAASLMPTAKQQKPLIFLAENYEEFPSLIKEAISYVDSDNYTHEVMSDAIKETSEEFTKDKLKVNLANYLSRSTNLDDEKYFNLNNLDLRLGRHHGFGDGVNGIGWTLDSFLNYLLLQKNESLLIDIAKTDPERYITKYTKFGILLSKNFIKENAFISFMKIITSRSKIIIKKVRSRIL